MPHCILEHSNNIIDNPDVRSLLLGIHDILMETGLFQRNDIKSRVIVHDQYVVGDGELSGCFVTLNICILSGRADEIKQSLAERALAFLKTAYPRSLEKLKCSITVQISDIHRESYRREISE